MKITPIAILIIFIILYIIVRNYKKDIKNIYIEIFELYFIVSIIMNIGYFFKLGNTDIGIDTFLSLIVLILSIFMMFRGYYNKKIMQIGYLFYACVVMSILGGLVFPYGGQWIHSVDLWDAYITGDVDMTGGISFSSQTVIYMIAVIRFPIILSVVSDFYKRGELKGILGLVGMAIITVIIYGVLEVLLKKLFGVDTSPFINMFFGEADATANGVDRLQGFCKEPSQYATILFGLSVFQIIEIKQSKGCAAKINAVNHLKLFLLLLLMVVSSSLMALIFALLVIIVYFFLIVPANKKIWWVAAGMVLLIVALIVIPKIEAISIRLERLWLAIKSLADGERFQSYTTSEAARFISMIEMFKLSVHRPLFGIGFGQTDAHSTLAALLGNCGYLGLISYLVILYRCGNKKMQWYNIYYLLLLSTMMISGGLGYFSKMTIPMLLLLYDEKNFTARGLRIENNNH